MPETTPLFGEIFDRNVAATPEAIAVEFQDQRLSYRELDDGSARLAAELVRRGVGPDSVVGIAASPSLHLPSAVLGILRAGAAWLPLDPAYPADRLRYMIADSGLTLLVADPQTARDPVYEGLETISPDVDGAAPAKPLAGEPRPSPAPGHLAYVIYTSGSTGRPKGVALTHRGLANLARAQSETFGVGPDGRVLQFAPTSFDASVFEMTMALSAGATLVLAPREDIAPGPGLADFLRDHRITHVTLPPSVLATLPEAALPDLAVLVCAGEALPEHLVEQWLPGRRMFNAYGPTEATVWATVAELTPGGGKPSIGTAIRGARTLVVDESMRPVPPGTPGELLIGGAGVARGYLGRPALTAQRFIPDTGTAGPGAARLYRTGDRVVERADGNLEFLGRLDHQVKIRGFRIEPDEIARQLAEHAQVTDAVVIPRDDGAGPQLVAYATGTGLDTARLRTHLAERLPAHMMPAVIVPLEQMPLTPSGKIDRENLPAPDRTPDTSGRTAPRSATERALAAVLADLLSLDSVGVDDDFFALGGHSLLAGRLAARVRSELGRELPLRRVYEARTVAAMALLIDSAAPSGGPTVPPIRARRRDDAHVPVPLSFPQERIWFLEKLSPGNLAYNAQAVIRLRGPLDADVLRATLNEIVRRHDVFRTAFREVDGRPTQFPQPPMEVELPLHDLTGLGTDEAAERADAIIRRTVQAAFDLTTPPLVRWVLIRHGEDDHTLVHVEHHLVHDGWSYALFLRELQELYPSLARGEASPLPEPAIGYSDFALWQREWLRGEVLDAYIAHWTRELDGIPPTLELPTDRPRPVGQSFRGSSVRIDLPGELCRGLRAYSRSRGTTLYSTMLAGFSAVMSRYCGQRDVVVGSGVANRRLTEIEQMMGMVVNTVPLRIDLSGEPDFDDLVGRVHDTVGRAHEWQDVPLDRLVDALALPRDPSRNPVFQVMFSFHDSQIPDLDFMGIRGSVRELHNDSAKTDINVVVLPRAEQHAGHGVGDDDSAITLIWEYATDLFDAETMRRMVQHYTTLLEEALRAPGLPFDRLPLLAADELADVLGGSRGAATAFPYDRTVPELFAEQAAARPDATALVAGGRSRTYAQVEERANRLAHLLRARGVGKDVPVGVLLERGDEMVITLLAVLKAGGGYVPLDPGYPAERLTAMLDDAAAPLVVTRAGLQGRLAPGAARTLILDEVAGELAQAPAHAPAAHATPDSLAYILFTSGSTGRPKGVMVEHRSVLRLVCGTDYVSFGPRERLAQVADASFDALTFELWGALLHGGAVCVIEAGQLLTPGGLAAALSEHGVTGMFLTSALFTEVMTQNPGTFAGLTNLLVGGDVLNVSRIRQLLDSPADQRPTRLINGYGPTETTTFAVCHLIESLPDGTASVPIGRPIANTTAHVLDPRLRPVPVGVPGELYIGGPGVARGYANRPGLTAERFLPDPYTGGGARMYRTGDVARYRRDGTLEFLGRADNQVKIRGYRIEPGEVETALTAHPGVGQAAVVVDDAPSGRRLVAYVASAPGRSAPPPDELRDFLSRTLPAYLLPAVYAEVAAMPLTTSGKVDRAALPAVADSRLPLEGHVSPRTVTERTLAELLADMLGIPDVGVTDDFFVLGGNSLLAMRLISKVNERFAVDLPLSDFLIAPTVERLAADVDAALASADAGRPPAPARETTREADSDEDLLHRIDELSDDEVNALLRDMAENEVER
ncbi:non-ribosomal peptide synthetase [Streptomyces sp. CB03234]|uniref:non-ribosomal peptide synthetase n=1 Tax=Streptomyces sp. (strain CB03234) TaxID=1703937 RepID=UPI00093F536A|nr:non-ribosomal peptide synthetase [Streptomyces sp. CB03234]OKK08052.1 non-ribosomal peptide synthetase [Streptomyces sp. CB03234]